MKNSKVTNSTKNVNVTSLISAIALNEFKKDIKQFDWIKESDQECRVSNVENTLADILLALKEDRFYVRVESVAKSGMSRVIALAYVKDNEIHGGA